MHFFLCKLCAVSCLNEKIQVFQVENEKDSDERKKCNLSQGANER